MTYGTTAYGSTAIGGATASQWFTFLPYQARFEGIYESELEFFGEEELFSVFSRKSNELISVPIQVFTRNDSGETPQLQGSFDGQLAQFVIGAARFIKVSASIPESGELIEVRGRAGD